MKNYLRPDFLFSITGILLLVCGLLFFHSKSDIVLHDTYFVFTQSYISVAIFLLFLIFGSIYFIFLKLNRQLKKGLGLTHWFISTVTILSIIFLFMFHSVEMPKRYYSSGEDINQTIRMTNNINALITVCVLVFALGQLLFLLNILLSLTKSRQQ